MKKINLEKLSDDELIERFVIAARQMGAAVLESEVRQVNRMYYLMRAIDLALRSRGEGARRKLLPLLNDKDRFVCYYAAQKSLGLAPDRARAVLEWNAKYWFDAIAGDAGMLLGAIDSGIYRPD